MFILGQRVDYYSLVDMRVQDINVVADLNRHEPNAPNPTEPAEHDGTGSPTSPQQAGADVRLTQAARCLTVYWTGWWPLLHMVVVHELAHPQTTLTLHTHTAKNLLGQTEYSSCSITGDAGVLGPADEDDEWMDTHLQTIVSDVLMMSITLAAGLLESAVRSPTPNPALIVVASALLTTAALLAVTLPSVFALYMVNKGEWTRADAGRFLWEIAYAWITRSLPVFGSLALGQAGASAGLLKAVATALARFAWLGKLLEFFLVATFAILLVGIALAIEAEMWLRG
ncbi:MAG: hypothetical protein HXY34_01585 [Candidatus Thorarchaeota archaeon]|nr:hypothetical protein [Candidatus Thorarchaeota archaeon]